MALVKASRDALLKPLQVVAGIVEKKNTMPILANVLIQKQGTELRFVATDTEMQVSTIAHLGGDSDDMAITVSARKVIDVLRALPDASEVAYRFTRAKQPLLPERAACPCKPWQLKSFRKSWSKSFLPTG